MTLPVACFSVGVRAASAPEGRIRLWSGREEHIRVASRWRSLS